MTDRPHDDSEEADWGAYVPGPRAARPPLQGGELAGLHFAAKDLFDVAGEVTTYGNPDWARTHPPAVATAPIITALLLDGAALTGKTRTVELAFGLTGENVWHGTPTNPAAPDRFPGGSSCGSAAAVAGGLVDFALGSDTGGSVRIPASYCGVFGFRPTQGAVSLAGARALAPSLDTPGWFARSAEVLQKVGHILLPGGRHGAETLGPLLRLDDVWAAVEPAVDAALRPALKTLQMHHSIHGLQAVRFGLPKMFHTYRAVQAVEAWATLGDWITATRPQFGPGVGERFEAARTMDLEAFRFGRMMRMMWQSSIRPLLASGAVLVYPTSPCPAPLLTADQAEHDRVREATLAITAIAGLAGLPEVTLPAARVDGAPVGLSLVAGIGRDRALLAFARKAAEALSWPE